MPKALPASTQAKNLFPSEGVPERVERISHKTPTREGSDVWNAFQTLAPASRIPLGSEVVEFDQGSFIITQAELQAEGIILRSEMERDAIIEDAVTEANAIRLQSHKDGLSNGLAQARANVEAELNVAFDQRCTTLKNEVDEVVNAIVTERELMWKSMEAEITALAMDIAKKVTKIEIDRNDKLVINVITDAMRRVSDRTNLRVLVNPTELANVRACREDLLGTLDGIKNLEIDPDRRIGSGGCVIETNAGSVDAKIETQFEQVENALRS